METILYNKQFDKLLYDVSYGKAHNPNSQQFGDWGAEEKGTEKWKGRLAKEWVWPRFSYLPGRRTNFYEITKVPISRDLWPWTWAHSWCRPTWGPSCASFVAIQTSAWEKKRFWWNHKSAHVTWTLTSTLPLSTPWTQAHLGTIMCKFGGDPTIFV